MPRKYENIRLTDRDEALIIWIAEQHVVRFDTLLNLVAFRFKPISRSDLYSLCNRWMRMGYVKKEKILGNAPTIIWATKSAMKLAGLPTFPKEKVSSPSFSTIHHNCAVSAVRLEYEKNGYRWICERRIRSEINPSHLPDGIADNNEFRIIVEVDRTQKEGKRLQNIMSINARTTGISCVDYWVTESVFPVVTDNIKKLSGDIRNRVRVFPLPLGVNK